MLRLLVLVVVPALAGNFDFRILDDVQNQVYSCDNQSASDNNNAYIYCYGRILEAVNCHDLYNDSKTFVDMPMINDPVTTLNAFNTRFPPSMNVTEINATDLQDWMKTYFADTGTELQRCNLSDWKPYPPKITNITDPVLRNWGLQLNALWKQLCRQMSPDIKKNIEKYSILYVPNPFIIPGGRFREFYYWDAYWIVKGLLISDMLQTVEYMIMNLASMVDKYGFVPNGGRVYYTKRSQPPLLSGMVYEYYEAGGKIDFVKSLLPTLEKELQFWQTKRAVNVTINNITYTVYQYHTTVNMPRAESYNDDMQRAKNVQADKRSAFFTHVASAAESGWDFSSRWFADKKNFQNIETTNIAPIDLNSFICWNMDILQFLYEKTGNTVDANRFRDMRSTFRDTVQKVFYNETDNTWYDYNLRTKSHNLGFYPANAVPLFTNCYNTLDQVKTENLFKYMTNTGVFEYESGVPTSMVKDSQEQWDFPNGWSPLNHMIVEGLRKGQNPQMQDQAFNIATKWVWGNLNVWKDTNHMYEKYDVIGSVPEPGFGGEYNVQDGFGWTNGVILDLLYTYSDRMVAPPNNPQTSNIPPTTPKSSTNLSILVSLFCIFTYYL